MLFLSAATTKAAVIYNTLGPLDSFDSLSSSDSLNLRPVLILDRDAGSQFTVAGVNHVLQSITLAVNNPLNNIAVETSCKSCGRRLVGQPGSKSNHLL